MHRIKTLEITFLDKEFRDLCLNPYLARKAFGDVVAERLRVRLADIAAAPFASDVLMLSGKPRVIVEEGFSRIVMDLADGHQLIFQCGHANERLLLSGSVDWSKVRRVKLLGVVKANE